MTDVDIWAELDALRRNAPAGSSIRQTTRPSESDANANNPLHQSSEEVTRRRLVEEKTRRKYAEAIGRLNNAICAQLHALWCNYGRSKIASDDYVTGSADSREKCDGCMPEFKKLKLYLVQDENGIVETFRRQKNYSEMYLRESALEDAELCGFIGMRQRRDEDDLVKRQAVKDANQRSRIDLSPYKCLIHACIEDYCPLPMNASKKMRGIYDLIHAKPLASVAVVAAYGSMTLTEVIYFCPRHVRFHICDEFCDQMQQGKHNERTCALTATVARRAENEMSLGDNGTNRDHPGMSNYGASGTAGGGGGGGGGDDGVGMVSHPDNDDVYALPIYRGAQAGETTASSTSTRSNAVYNAVSVIRDHNSRTAASGMPVKRGRGRGRGSIAGGSAERSRLERIRLAQAMVKSSGDDDAPDISPLDAAAQFERIAGGDMARRSSSNAAGENSSRRSTSKRRKQSRAKRVKSRLANGPVHMSLDVPEKLIMRAGVDGGVIDSDSDSGEAVETIDVDCEPSVEPESQRAGENEEKKKKPFAQREKKERDVIMGARLATPVGQTYAEMPDTAIVKRANDTVTVSFSLGSKPPFAERIAGLHDKSAALDALTEERDHPSRLARFRLEGGGAMNTFDLSTEVFEHYGERTSAIIWHLYCSQERDAIESHKLAVCLNKTRDEIDGYCRAQRNDRSVCYMERIDRICRAVHDRAGICKTTTVDEPLWDVIETYTALLVIEFYFNLVSMPPSIAAHLSRETAATIQSQFCFESFVPAILSFFCEGLEINHVVVLPRDTFIIREYWPQTATLRTMGIADETMTHLTSTIRAYFEAVRSSNVSMRRFQATVIDYETLVGLGLPGMIPGTEKMSSKDLARAAAHQLVMIFIAERAQRLRSLVHA